MKYAAAAIALAAALPALAGPAMGDPARGAVAFQKCYACHAMEPGRNNLTGPNLHGIVGRPIAAESGFAYSPALKAYAARHRRWSPRLLERYIADPEAEVPKTAMTFTGMKSAAERADLIAFLRRPEGH